jgi:RNA polymerase sigma-70 factor (ECF subfamily)
MEQNIFVDRVMPFKDKLFRFAKRILISSEEAEDATQEVLLKLWNRRNDLDKYKSLEAFAMTITKNYCLDKLKNKHSSNLSLVHSNYDSGSKNPEQITELNNTVDLVKEVIKTLPEQQRMAIQLRDIEHYTLEEMEEVLGVSNSTIRVNLSRARKKVREELIKTSNYGIG